MSGRNRTLVGVLAVMAAGLLLVAWVTGSLFGSDVREKIEDDPSWLAYLPPEEPRLGLTLASITYVGGSGSNGRLVDFVVDDSEETVSLCFAATRAAVEDVCAGADFLGFAGREEMGLRAVSITGTAGRNIDWVRLLSGPVPTLDELQYLA